MLRRVGCKKRLLNTMLPLFPACKIFIDMFFGSGTVSFAMLPRVNHVFANDNDDEVYNLFWVCRDRKEELLEAIKIMPTHQKLFDYWKKHEEEDPIWKAVRFLMRSNFGHLGGDGTFRIDVCYDKAKLLNDFDQFHTFIQDIKFIHGDFRKNIKKIRFGNFKPPDIFIYADPPYLATSNTYKTGFTLQDTQDLFDLLVNSGFKFAISSYNNPAILELAEAHGLKVIVLKEIRSIKSRNTEILIVNYKVEQQGNLFT